MDQKLQYILQHFGNKRFLWNSGMESHLLKYEYQNPTVLSHVLSHCLQSTKILNNKTLQGPRRLVNPQKHSSSTQFGRIETGQQIIYLGAL